MTSTIPFNRPYSSGDELRHIARAMETRHLDGDGPFTKACQGWIERETGTRRSLLTHSCTGALELAAMLLRIRPGDEVIMPSYTFSSTANAFALRGGVPVFVDIREDTLNIDECLIERAITPRTKAIVVVHYAGVACEMDSILELASGKGIAVVEDAAQAISATYRGRSLGAIGDIGAFSFHATKNIISGEGGAILLNRTEFVVDAEIIREKGTDRTRFLRGEVDKYSWRQIGSSFLPSEITAAYLWAQLEHAAEITAARIAIWDRYFELCETLEREGWLRRPVVPEGCGHNGHLFYVVLRDHSRRSKVLAHMRREGVVATSHYVPLHDSTAGGAFTRSEGLMPVTESASKGLLRLPLWIGLSEPDLVRIVETLHSALLSI